jgi:prevent-host-death family protein
MIKSLLQVDFFEEVIRMPIIKPISDLRNNFNYISEVCHTEGEPVFITKNGHEDLVVMSHAFYEKQQAIIELYQKLAEAEKESTDPLVQKIDHSELMSKLRSHIHGEKLSD